MANELKSETKAQVVSLLCEGNSIRSAPLNASPAFTAILSCVLVGTACAKIQDEKMRGLSCKQIEVDEIWVFVGAKRKNANRTGNYSDVWTFIALDADTKLIPSFVVGKRDAYHTKMFISDLVARMQNFEAAVAMNFAYYNFVKTHGAIRMTPAQAAGVESCAWTVAERVERCGE